METAHLLRLYAVVYVVVNVTKHIQKVEYVQQRPFWRVKSHYQLNTIMVREEPSSYGENK